jgi:DNA-directed RNA polymerase delta subunit
MKLKSIDKDTLETMQLDDIAYIILKEKGKKMKITDIFKTICDALGMTDKEYENQIGDFFTLLATEKRFIQLEKGYWDLRENHTSEINIQDLEDDIDDDIELENPDDDNISEEDEGDYYDTIDDMDDDDSDDDLKDLVIVDEGYDDDSDL